MFSDASKRYLFIITPPTAADLQTHMYAYTVTHTHTQMMSSLPYLVYLLMTDAIAPGCELSAGNPGRIGEKISIYRSVCVCVRASVCGWVGRCITVNRSHIDINCRKFWRHNGVLLFQSSRLKEPLNVSLGYTKGYYLLPTISFFSRFVCYHTNTSLQSQKEPLLVLCILCDY